MDYLESLRVFRSVVELRSFTRAADLHGLSRPAVSRTIAQLESHIGCRLLNRTTRQISLTEAAEQFYAGCVRILDDLEALEADVATQAREPSGVLRLAAHTATSSRLVRLIAGFRQTYPKVTLDVTLTERPIDLVADGYDLGVLIPYVLTSDMAVVRLLERIPFVIVATPGYLRTWSTPEHPSDLHRHRFVPMSPSIRRPAIGFRLGDEELSIAMRFDVCSNSPAFNRELVLHGIGIGIAPLSLVEKELQSGELVRLLADFPLIQDSVDIQLAYSNRTLQAAKVRAFIDYAVAFFQRTAR